jgi:hypothetical protein
MSAEAFGNFLIIVGVVLGLLILVLFLGSLVWLYQDAQSRGKTGCLWALIAFFTWPFGLIAYILLRDQEVKL